MSSPRRLLLERDDVSWVIDVLSDLELLRAPLVVGSRSQRGD